MTLATLIVVKDPVPVEALFRYGQSLLSADPTSQKWERREAEEGDFRWTINPQIRNTIGQGLPSMFIVTYGADGPLDLGPPDYADDDPDWNKHEDQRREHQSGCVHIDLDTSYGYRGPNGGGCSDLHAWLVLMLGSWVERYGARFEWQQEFTGDWFDSVLDVHELGDPERGRLPHFAAEDGDA